MSKRFTSAEKWDKDWFQSLDPRLKCLWIYITDKCDIAGIWEMNFRLASYQIGSEVSAADLEGFGGRVEVIAEDKLWVTRFIPFQQGRLSPHSAPHKSIVKALKTRGLWAKVPDEWLSAARGEYVAESPNASKGKVRVTKPLGRGYSNSNSNSNSRLEDVAEIIAHLNAATGSNFQADSQHNIGAIKARLESPGVTVEGVKQMIDAKCAEWGADAKLAKFLRPKTLFGPENFENYYGQRGAKKITRPNRAANGTILKTVLPEGYTK